MASDAQLDWQQRIDRAKHLIETRLDEDISLEGLAAEACASMFHFHRMFRGMTGETVREYSRRLRLERAAYRLTHTADDILTIAMDNGYESHEAFTRAFKRRFHTTPSSFRDDRREIAEWKGSQAMTRAIEVRIEHQPAKRIAFVRHVGPYNEVGDAWGTLMKWGWSKMIFGKAETFGLCFDDPEVTPADRLRYDACMVVGEKARPKGDVQIRALPEATYAVALHEGALDRISETYSHLFVRVANDRVEGRRWLLGDPPSMERYLCDPRKVKPEAMRTEICMPVQSAHAVAGVGS